MRIDSLSQDEQNLVKAAMEARKRAYAPYSHFAVGAALHAPDKRVYMGCNVENASYSATICAECSAVAHAVAEGCTEFDLLVIATNTSPPSPPCGVCRQVLSEFAKDKLRILLVNPCGEVIKTSLKKLLPMAFSSR